MNATNLPLAVSAIDAPALVVDLDAMERNIARLADYARERGLRLRPHAKSHKSAWIAAQPSRRSGICGAPPSW